MIISNLNQNTNGEKRDKRKNKDHSSSITRSDQRYSYKTVRVSIIGIFKDNSLEA